MISGEKTANICPWFKSKIFTMCCIIASIVLMCTMLLTCNFGFSIIVNGKVIGTAPSKEYVNNLIDSINEELAPYLSGKDAVSIEPSLAPKIVIGKDFTSRQNLGEALKKYCPYLEKAYSVKSNGRTVVAFRTKEERQKCYDAFISNMTKSFSSYRILDNVTFEYELVPYGLVKTGKGAVIMLERTYDFDEKVKINRRCKLKDILTSYAISKEDFSKLNPDYEEGKTYTAIIKSKIPYIRIAGTESYIEGEILPHSITYEEDDTILKGNTEVKHNGKNGFVKTEITKYVLNGRALYEKEGKTTSADAEDTVMLVGTKEPKYILGTGDLAKPCTGVLTSRYGPRNGRMHKGVDIGDAEGTPITAADAGTVIYARWNDGGYGNLVKIDHGNGIVTLYAHCQEIYVNEGDCVEKGDVISAMGNTGRSEGPHLHFEVIDTKKGETIDPLEFFEFS